MIDVVCAIIIRNRKFLVVQKDENSSHPFCWEFPGGKIKPGEQEVEALSREIYEELETSIQILQKIIPVEYDYKIKKIRLIPYICSMVEDIPKMNEHINFKWINLNELNNLDLTKADKELIQMEGNKKILSEYCGDNMKQ